MNMGTEAENVSSLFFRLQVDQYVWCRRGCGLLEGVKIKIDNSEFVYYVMNATLYS